MHHHEPIAREAVSRSIEDAVHHALFPTENDPVTPEHRLTLHLALLGGKLEALPERIADALNGKKRKRDKAKAAILPTGGGVAALVWLLKMFDVIG